MSSPVSALAGLLHEAGISWAAADEIDAAIDRAFGENFGSDDVASALWRWRTKCVSRALGECRKRSRSVLQGNGTNDNMEDVLGGVIHESDVEGQIGLFDTLDERTWAAAARAPQQDGR